MDWTDVFKDAIGGFTQVEIAKAQQPQNPYLWGQPGYGQPIMGAGGMGGMGSMMPLLLLAGAGVLAIVLLRD